MYRAIDNLSIEAYIIRMELPQPTEAERKLAERIAKRIIAMAREQSGTRFIHSESEVVNDALRGIAFTLAEARVAASQKAN